MIRYGQQLRNNTHGKITVLDFEKAWRIQRIELNLPSEVGQEELTVKDRYEGVSNGELILQLETLTAKYKQSLLLRNKEKINRQQGLVFVTSN